MSSKLRLLILFFAGAAAGVAGEGVLLMQARVREAARALSDDFVVVVFLKEGVSPERGKVVEEKLLALEGTESVEFVPPEESLARIETREPAVTESVAVLGQNPLPGAFEVRLLPGAVGKVPAWIEAAASLEETAEVVSQPLRVRGIREALFHESLLSMVMSLSAVFAALIVAAFAFGLLLGGGCGAGLLARATGAALAGAAAGQGAAFAAVSSAEPVWLVAFPAVVPQAALWLLAGLGLGVVGTGGAEPRRAGLHGGDEDARPAEPRNMGAQRRKPAGPGRKAVFAALIVAVASGAHAASLRSKRKELDKVKEGIDSARREAVLYRKKEIDSRRSLKRLQNESRTVRSKIAGIESERRRIDDARRELSGRLRTLKEVRAAGSEILAEEIRGYSLRAAARSDFEDSGALWSDAFHRAAMRDQTVYLARLSALQTGTAERHGLTLEKGSELLRRESRRRLELRRKDESLKEVETAVSAARQKVLEAEQRAEELRAEAAALAALIRRLERKGGKAAAYAADPPVPKRSLPWPAGGKILLSFGKHRDPELNTWTIRNGIEVGAGSGEVAPVLKGTVIYSGPFRSYGNVLIVDHGDGFFSIYGKLSKVLRNKGDRVRPGTPMAEAKNRMYLELRQAGRPLDPLVWLRER